MNSSVPSQLPKPHWRCLYEAAVLEVNEAKLPDRIEEARKAIHARLGELTSSAQNSEWEPLIDALNNLDDLLRMHNARNSRPHKEAH
jgi:hypothetical protein